MAVRRGKGVDILHTYGDQVRKLNLFFFKMCLILFDQCNLQLKGFHRRYCRDPVCIKGTVFQRYPCHRNLIKRHRFSGMNILNSANFSIVFEKELLLLLQRNHK